MKKIFFRLSAVSCLLLLSIMLLVSCKKDITDLINLPSIPTDTANDIPAFTAVGSPVGNPVTKTIGPNGGLISSVDGIVQLNIPPGALSANTDITIQPITNECPGGIGLVYDFLPNGTKFKVPATLSFHYTDDDLSGTNPYFIFIAYQDSLYEWMADMINRSVDTMAKTVSLDISHFTGYGKGTSSLCYAIPDELQKSQTSIVQAVYSMPPPAAPKGSTPSDDDLAPLGVHKFLSNITNWKVDGIPGGNSKIGTIAGSGSSVTYTAPASIPNKKTVHITASYNVPIEFFDKHKVKTTYNSVPIGGSITLLPDTYSYDVKIYYEEFGTTACFVDEYTDSASMQVKVENDEVTISNILNYKPNTKPSSGPHPNEHETCTWIPDSTGIVNIVSASGTVSPAGQPAPGTEKMVSIICNDGGKALYPKWEEKDTGNNMITYSGGQQWIGFPGSITITLNDKPQLFEIKSPFSQDGRGSHVKVVITPN